VQSRNAFIFSILETFPFIIFGFNIRTIVFGMKEFEWEQKSKFPDLILKSVPLYLSQFGLRKRQELCLRRISQSITACVSPTERGRKCLQNKARLARYPKRGAPCQNTEVVKPRNYVLKSF
jgi:hypothetical protein